MLGKVITFTVVILGVAGFLFGIVIYLNSFGNDAPDRTNVRSQYLIDVRLPKIDFKALFR